jgi:hypothetical protein
LTICEWYSQRLVDFSGYPPCETAGTLKQVHGALSFGAGDMDIRRIGTQPSVRGPVEWFTGSIAIAEALDGKV